MNYFALAVITLQVCAAAQFTWGKHYPDAVVYAAAAAINIALMMKGST